MSLSVLGFLVILVVMIYFFLSERVPVDLTAVCGLLVITLFGFLTPEQAFVGFSSPAIITMVSMFVIGSALTRTGVAQRISRRISRLIGDQEVVNVVAVMAMAAVVSAFMNNVAATALLLPAVSSIANRSGIPPSRLLIPLAFGTILGGMITIIGTSPNILMADVLRDAGLEPFAFHDFTVFGVAATVTGIAYMAIAGRHLLPRRDVAKRAKSRTADLTTLYKIYERMFSLRIPSGSSLSGKTIGEVQFGRVLGVQIVSIVRDEDKIYYPRPDDEIKDNDLLIAQGKISALEELLKFRGVEVGAIEADQLAELGSNVSGAALQVVAGSAIVGESLRNLQFRNRYGIVVLGIQRGEERLTKELASQELRAGDVLKVIGKEEVINQIADSAEFERTESAVGLKDLVRPGVFLVNVPDASLLDGVTLGDSRMGELLGLRAIAIIREKNSLFALEGREVVRAGDSLLVVGAREHVEALGELGAIEIESTEIESKLESDKIGVVEVVLSPRSKAISKTLVEINFREKYDYQALAVWRAGKPYRAGLAGMQLQLGDALLLHGPRSKVHLLNDEEDFVVLSEDLATDTRHSKAPYAIAALFAVICLSVLGILPVHFAAFVGAVGVALAGATTMEEAYRDVSWRVVFLVASLIPLGIAVHSSGTAQFVADLIINSMGGFGPYPVFIVLCLCASLVSQALDGTVAVVLLSPIAIILTQQLGVSPYSFMMGIALCASVAFMTPFSHKASLLVMGAGGYRSKDYFRVGTGLSVVVIIVLMLLIPLIMPF